MRIGKIKRNLFIIFTVVGAIVMGLNNMPLQKSAEEINAAPDWLNGKVLRRGSLAHIIIEDRVIRGMKLDDMQIENFTARNVIFIDCHFVATRIQKATFDNVKFQGGSFQSRGNFDDFEKRTKFYEIDKFDVIFDNVSFFQPAFEGIRSGNVTLKNIKNYQVTTESHNLFLGSNMNVRIDNCNFAKSAIVVAGGNTNIYMTNTVVERQGFPSSCKSLYVDKCIIDGSLGYAETGVVKDSTVLVNIKGNAIYFQNCTFLEKKRNKLTRTIFLGNSDDRYFVLGANGPVPLSIASGSVTLHDVELQDLLIWSPWKEVPIQAIHLRNVSLRGGGVIKTIIKKSNWENVKIYPEVDIEGANFEHLTGYNVTFPDGSPWVGKPVKAAITVCTTPFEWPEIKVPTPEELGLIWDWPEPTGAPVQ